MIWHYTCIHCKTEGHTATRKPTCSTCGKDVIPRQNGEQVQDDEAVRYLLDHRTTNPTIDADGNMQFEAKVPFNSKGWKVTSLEVAP